ncbi:TonB family protein [Mucilaginibacter sp. UR6-1]|uniref:M56 family metallopeptidase n=1 Tax=Mucilaginibacter sp. UR6-1 TaxID=1435643 RepID=UPI001E5A151B|nr:M56 family metallopeptidase [Mucilaginibacter sp. UR6-1]MCC8410733.1 TonB family protein [Mucilaginibacter sp. UR6-1]
MNWWQYLILANLYLGLFYGFYALLLRKETFFQLNRIYLVSSAAISFLLPLIQADWVQNLFITRQVKQVIFNAPVIALQYTGKTETDFLSVGHLIAYAYLAGLLAFAIRFTWQLASLQRLISRHTAGAYSFFKKVQVSGELSEHEVVSAHEHVHARQWHSADVMLIELISIINWFNPVIYLYRNAVKHTHEFIADRQVIDAGADKAGYAMLLLNQTFNAPVHNLVNPFFNHSLLKQRIMMLQKNRSQRVKLLKYGLSAPLFVLMLILSSATINDNKTVLAINKKAEKVMETSVTDVVPKEYIIIDEPIIKQQPKQTVKQIEIVEPQTLKAEAKQLELMLDTVPKKSNEVFTAVEQLPEFPGGLKAFGKYLQNSIKYPAEDVKNKASGKVFVQFIVEEDGALSNLNVLRGVSATINAEAVRVLKASPKWSPGKQNGHPVRVQFTVPIAFNLPAADNAVKESEKQGTLIPGNGDDEKQATTSFKGEKVKGNVNDVVVIGFAAKDTAKLGTGLILRGDKSDLKNVTYYLNGKEMTAKEMKELNPNSIKSIDVIKDSSKKEGEKGYGKVMVTTK